jgi:acyl phosphate:glycerol-3-phosphate acyltransferase
MSGPGVFLWMMAAGYVAGSVNFSIVLFRLSGRGDPRLHGSGNPGATNVYRQAGLAWAASVLLLDMGRAIAVALAAAAVLPAWQTPWVGLGLIVGNRFPCFHGFKGGKGVANYLGFTVVMAPFWAATGALAWVATHLVWRTAFLSSFALVFFLTVGTVFAEGVGWQGGVGAGVTALFIVACHHRNIRDRWGG